ncbi:MAG: hypothetical protein ACI308_10775 [Muribaculaceae bacterium]
MMKLIETKKIILTAMATLLLCALAPATEAKTKTKKDVAPEDTAKNVLTFSVMSKARPKGDKGVILRWAPEEYAPWVYINQWGYKILRSHINEQGEFVIDTIVTNLRPLTIDELKAKFEPTDSLAGAAAQLLWSKEEPLKEQSDKTVIDRIDEQATKFAYAMLLAEIRQDLAEAMALRFVDRTAKPGVEYDYIVTTVMPDTIMRIRTTLLTVKNDPEEPAPFTAQLRDSIGTDGRSISVMWPFSSEFSTFDIERSDDDGKSWKKLNNRPFLTFMTSENENDANHIFVDTDLQPGVYTYRVKGYDTFGDVSNYCEPLTVELPDIIPPAPPLIRSFNVDRESQPGKVFVNITWRKDSIEEDMTGFNVYYYNKKEGDDWRQMNDKLIAPTDTSYVCEVKDIKGGFFVVASIDRDGNRGVSMPRELMLADYVAPVAPAGLKHTISPLGIVTIQWDRNPEDDVNGYQLFAANDTTHTFLPLPGKFTQSTMAIDTIAIHGINQRYIYYKVQAYDFAGNSSELSEPLQVKRLNYDRPEAVRPDSIWLDNEGNVHTRWIASHNADIEVYNIYRRVDHSNDTWKLMATVNPDSVTDEKFTVIDNPEYSKKPYNYAVDAINTTGITADRSLMQTIYKRMPSYIEIPVTLSGRFDEKTKMSVLTWKINGKVPYTPRGYVINLERQTPSGAFQTRYEIPSEDSEFREYLSEGQSVTYRIVLRLSNGQRSFPSNEVTVTYKKVGNL